MTALKERLRELIAAAGPISVSDYMASCLFDPDAGYYTTREPFGVAGDFTTAPEISQMFGELVAVWAYSAWAAMDRPMPMTLAEIGPGRGTLMADMLRTLDRLDTGFVTRARIALIEASPRLAALQKERLASGRGRPTWFSEIAALPATPLVIVGNELFDALPVRQFVRTAQGWPERVVGLDNDGALRFMAGAAGIDPALLPHGAMDAPEGAIFETAPAREALMAGISARIVRDGGAALFIDYGHLRPGLGDTLQAVRKHAYDDALANPGEADLTSHVDFFALARIAQAHGLEVRTTTQGAFLVGLGLLERAGALGAAADEATRERLRGEVERLAGPEAMGDLFKVLCVTRKGTVLPPFAAQG
ncbi:MAG: class I SAM-dependent methyltransferase [Aquamicrobium sp.]|uniref:class I SAM-dependent methyltransferase n=1 Tax=Aquamicrobium sp. TaxID=1872579 RepID=UPI00349E87D5|nr:class I SAM-dependent methyltransferase [Aquamicrobium sp.]